MTIVFTLLVISTVLWMLASFMSLASKVRIGTEFSKVHHFTAGFLIASWLPILDTYIAGCVQ